MRVIPVLDVREGEALHAVRGQRRHYARLESVWVPGSSDPVMLAHAYKRKYQFDTPLELYLADLDAIEKTAPPNFPLYRTLADLGLRLWVDAGARRADLGDWFQAGIDVAVLGLETLDGPEPLQESVDRWGPERIVFSLDLRDGRPLIDALPAWGTNELAELAELAWALGVRRLIALDLARVGSREGASAEILTLCETLNTLAPSGTEYFVGGGVRSRADLEPLRQRGVGGVLVGTALHQGLIEPYDLNDWLPDPSAESQPPT